MRLVAENGIWPAKIQPKVIHNPILPLKFFCFIKPKNWRFYSKTYPPKKGLWGGGEGQKYFPKETKCDHHINKEEENEFKKSCVNDISLFGDAFLKTLYVTDKIFDSKSRKYTQLIIGIFFFFFNNIKQN